MVIKKFTLTNDCYFPNTKPVRDKLKQLGLSLRALPSHEHVTEDRFPSITFRYGSTFKDMQITSNLYLSMHRPKLTQEAVLYLFDILYVCPDIDTFKQAMQQYINNPLE